MQNSSLALSQPTHVDSTGSPDKSSINRNLLAPRPLRVVVLREELVALTGDPYQAMALNQFLYWTERVHDFDKFLEEEYERNPDCNVELRHGWIVKRSKDLIKELMLNISEVTMRRIIASLVKNGWLEQTRRQDGRWNNTLCYRVNIKKVQIDLFDLGFPLNGFPLLIQHLQDRSTSSSGGQGARPLNKTSSTSSAKVVPINSARQSI